MCCSVGATSSTSVVAVNDGRPSVTVSVAPIVVTSTEVTTHSAVPVAEWRGGAKSYTYVDAVAGPDTCRATA